MAPTVETHTEKKKSGIRRLLSPVIFSGEAHRRKEVAAAAAETKIPRSSPKHHSSEVSRKTSVETAFVGISQIPRTKVTRKTRSQSLSPIRHGSCTRTEACLNAVENVDTTNYFSGGVPKGATIERHKYMVADGKIYSQSAAAATSTAPASHNYSTNLVQMKTRNTSNSSDSSFSLASASPTPIPRNGIKDDHKRMNASSENVSNYSQDCTNVAHNRSGRTSAPPAPYSQYYTRSSHKSQVPYFNDVADSMRYGFNEYQKQLNNRSVKEMPEKDYVIKKRISPIMFCRKEVVASDRRVANSSIPTYNQCRTILRPQPLYRNTEEPPRPRSVSPITGSNKENIFVRGSTQRSTISGYYPRQSIIYEEETKEARLLKDISPTSRSGPIFKRGTLVASNKSPVNINNVSKKVSFSPSQETSSEPIYWPTRKGLAVEPPTRQSARRDPSDKSVYVNLPAPATRPLPSLPNCHTGTGYGTVNKSYRPALTANTKMLVNRWQQQSESESGSEAGEVQRILQNGEFKEEEWAGDSKGRGPVKADQNGTCRADDEVRRNRSNRREDPRRHTLSGDHHLSTNYQNNVLNRSMDLESPLSRGYPPPSNSMLFDEDPGIMSEVETSSTGFRRGNKQRSSLPVVRTPSKTLERPLGLVFLQYRNETKRSLLPNEITSLDTVKALFVRSFPKQLTMEYLDSPQVKIYIHDSNKDMFYELEDLRSHLNEIRDRTVLRLFESADVGGGNLPSGLSAPAQMWNDQDQSYFSEPEFDSEFQHQHIHKTKGNKSNLSHQPYYMTHSFPPGSSASLPRGGSLLRPFSPAGSVTSKNHAGFMSSPERAAAPSRGYSPYSRNVYEDPYYSQYGTRPSSITPIIDEETSDTDLLDDGYSLYSGVKLPAAAPSRSGSFGLSTTPSGPPFDPTRYKMLRVEHMERQLANLTGLVQKALTQTVPTPSPRERDLSVSSDDSFVRTDFKPPKLGKDKSVSFEKSVSFSDDPPGMNSPKQHSPQHTDSKPTKPAIKSSTLPRTSSQEKERLKPVPPAKPLSLTTQYDGRALYRDLQLTPEMYNQLRGLQKKAKDLRQEVRSLRRMSQAQAHSVRETVKDTYIKIRAMVLNGGESLWAGGADSERIKISREEDIYKQEIISLEDDLTLLESTVEELRSNVINRKTRVNMSDVENMALILSKSSKTVADLKLKFPLLQGMMKAIMTLEMKRVVVEENFLKDEPERLESALRRCKKLTGTLVTLKRLASVQEQRLPDNRLSPTSDEPPMTPTSGKGDGTGHVLGATGIAGAGGRPDTNSNRTENSIDSLLDELQTAKTVVTPAGSGTLRRLHSFPTSETKPPVPERHPELSGKRIPPPPPPRTSSKSPLASPTNPNAPVRLSNSAPRKGSLGSLTKILKDKLEQPSASTSSSCESINSQEGIQQAQSRQEQLEQRHQELLRKQKALQEQYTRLQQLQKTTSPPDLVQLKKTGSESNILAKIGMGMSATSISSSLSQLPPAVPTTTEKKTETSSSDSSTSTASTATTASKTKIYETDIL